MDFSKIRETNTNDIQSLSFEDYTTLAKVISVYDGDTVTLGFCIPNTDLIFKWKCRLLGIDTPELRTKNEIEKKCATEARDALKLKIPIGSIVKIRCGDFDKYGRILVRIFTINSDNIEIECINDFLVNNKYAKEYDGGKKQEFAQN